MPTGYFGLKEFPLRQSRKEGSCGKRGLPQEKKQWHHMSIASTSQLGICKRVIHAVDKLLHLVVYPIHRASIPTGVACGFCSFTVFSLAQRRPLNLLVSRFGEPFLVMATKGDCLLLLDPNWTPQHTGRTTLNVTSLCFKGH